MLACSMRAVGYGRPLMLLVAKDQELPDDPQPGTELARLPLPRRALQSRDGSRAVLTRGG